MPDYVVVISLFVLLITGEITFLSGCVTRHGSAVCPNGKRYSLFAIIPFLLIFIWLVWASNGTWKMDTTKDFPIHDYKHFDGSITQYLDGQNPEVEFHIRRDDHRFYPPGSLIRRHYHESWCRGIKWSDTTNDEVIVGEQK